MRYLLNGKVYDTEKSQVVTTYTKSVEQKGIINTYPKYLHTIYKSAKGQFFTHIGKYVGPTGISFEDKDYIQLTTEDEVKQILEILNELDIYIEFFGEPEEG